MVVLASSLAVVLTLEPGIYTAQMRGVEGATGIGKSELYEGKRPTGGLVVE